MTAGNCRYPLSYTVRNANSSLLTIPQVVSSAVIQNNLQFVAVSNLEAATFQVSYQMKILTTAAFSVVLLRKKLSPTKWLALLFLAIGVGIVQIQSGSHKSSESVERDMNAFKGFMAVVAACFTSGLAGVYFEMVLKNSPADLWVRNVQLSLFSLLPALVPIVFSGSSNASASSGWFSTSLFENFGVWAWATVLTQVLGGLLTALVIKYADNILKGFATSLSIVISFLASVALFHFQITVSFILGALVVLVATWLYNQPDTSSSTSGSDASSRESRSWGWRWRRPTLTSSHSASALELSGGMLSRRASTSSLSSLASFTNSGTARPHYHHSPSKSFPTSPLERVSPTTPEPSPRKQGQFFAAPMRATKVFAKRMALFRSASFSGQAHADNGQEYQLLTQSVSYPASRPGSALAAYPGSRPPSSIASSARPSMDRAP